MKLLAVNYVTQYDRNGNTYHAIEVTNLATGATGRAVVDHIGNIETYLHRIFGDGIYSHKTVRPPSPVYGHKTELKSREYDRFISGCEYVHSESGLVQWLKANIGFEYPAALSEPSFSTPNFGIESAPQVDNDKGVEQ